MRQYLIWNEEKVSQGFECPPEEQNYQRILTLETHRGVSISSTIMAANNAHAAKIVEAFCNETDVNLKWQALPSRLEVRLYREADYSGYSEAHADGAVYGTGIYFSLTELYDKPDLVEIILNAVGMTSKCINGDQAEIQIVLVDTEQPDQVFDFLHEYAPNFKRV